MSSSTHMEHEAFARRHRGGMLLERHGLELYPHPFLGFTLAPGYRSELLNTDDEGFRLSDSPFGTVDCASWLAAGGGGIVLGNSVAVALAASSDGTTPASYLARLTGTRQLNLGLCAAVSLQEVVAAIPFLPAASTVVIIGGGPDFINLAASLAPVGHYGTVSYERTFDDLTQIPLFDLAALAAGERVSGLHTRRLAPRQNVTWDLANVERRMVTAADRRVRDLGFLARSVGEGTRVVMCLQPIASTRTREITPEERARYPHFDFPVFGILHSAIEDNWGAYADRLAAGCADLGVSFLNLAARDFVGDSFADTVHMNDNGNMQAARRIQEALEAAAPVRGWTNGRAPLPAVPAPAAVAPVPDVPQPAARADRPAAAAVDTGDDWVGQVEQVVTEVLELEPGQLTLTGDFVNDYGADSMMAIDIISRLEQEMDVRIPDEALPEMTTVAAVIALAKRHAGEAATHA